MKEKIPFYNIVNMFFVGAVYSILSFLLFHDLFFKYEMGEFEYSVLKDWNAVISASIIVLVYEIGFILNRMSSIFIAPLLEKLKIWPKEKYDIDVSEISKENPKFQSMITDLILIRTHILIYIILAIEGLFSSYKCIWIYCLLFVAILTLSGRKTNSRINIIRKSYVCKKAEEISEEMSTDNVSSIQDNIDCMHSDNQKLK